MLHAPPSQPSSGQKRKATRRLAAAGSWKNAENAASAFVHLLLSLMEPLLSTAMNMFTGTSTASSLEVAQAESGSRPPSPPEEVVVGSIVSSPPRPVPLVSPVLLPPPLPSMSLSSALGEHAASWAASAPNTTAVSPMALLARRRRSMGEISWRVR
jgi:hypothetical protein